MLKDLDCPCFVRAARASQQWGDEGLERVKFRIKPTLGKEMVWRVKCGQVPKKGWGSRKNVSYNLLPHHHGHNMQNSLIGALPWGVATYISNP